MVQTPQQYEMCIDIALECATGEANPDEWEGAIEKVAGHAGVAQRKTENRSERFSDL